MAVWAVFKGGLSKSKVNEFIAALHIGSSAGDATAVELLSRWVQNGAPANTHCDDPSDAACLQMNNNEATVDAMTASSIRKKRKVSKDKSVLISSDDDGSYSYSGKEATVKC